VSFQVCVGISLFPALPQYDLFVPRVACGLDIINYNIAVCILSDEKETGKTICTITSRGSSKVYFATAL